MATAIVRVAAVIRHDKPHRGGQFVQVVRTRWIGAIAYPFWSLVAVSDFNETKLIILYEKSGHNYDN